jgi:hypothetical protein
MAEKSPFIARCVSGEMYVDSIVVCDCGWDDNDEEQDDEGGGDKGGKVWGIGEFGGEWGGDESGDVGGEVISLIGIFFTLPFTANDSNDHTIISPFEVEITRLLPQSRAQVVQLGYGERLFSTKWRSTYLLFCHLSSNLRSSMNFFFQKQL